MDLFTRLFPPDGQTQLWVLFDPDQLAQSNLIELAAEVGKNGADAILVGGSLLFRADFDEFILSLKGATSLPIVLFPGDGRQLSRHADGLLFMSLLSGRNPQYLIGEQVMAAPIIKQMQIETISTAYLLIESGRTTSAEFVSNTHPIPRDKPYIAAAHGIAAEMFGMKTVYLEAGSGAENHVPTEVVRAVSQSVSIPVIVGGGIRTPETAREIAETGARAVVIGTAVEQGGSSTVREIAIALRS